MLHKGTILYLDDEQVNLDVFEASFDDEYEVLTANNFKKALELLRLNEIKVVITDQRMPDITGIEFIQLTQPLNPHTVFIIISAFPDNDVLLSSINKTSLFRFMVKPWHEFDMRQTIEAAIKLYNSKNEKQKLMLDLQIANAKAQESDRLKKAFLANLSHEIRTPLNAILGFSSILDTAINKEKLKDYKKVIEDSGHQLLSVIEDIITMSELESKNMGANLSGFDLIVFFRNLERRYSALLAGKEIELKIEGINKYKELTVFADKSKLHEVFNQLLNNALKFTEKGQVSFGIVRQESPVFFVRDTGIGIPVDKQKVIFEKFRQENEQVVSRTYGGNGLGLSIAREFVEMQGGNIWVHSEKGKGAAFYFTLPSIRIRTSG